MAMAGKQATSALASGVYTSPLLICPSPPTKAALTLLVNIGLRLRFVSIFVILVGQIYLLVLCKKLSVRRESLHFPVTFLSRTSSSQCFEKAVARAVGLKCYRSQPVTWL